MKSVLKEYYYGLSRLSIKEKKPMKKFKNKLICILVVLTLVIGLMPISAFSNEISGDEVTNSSDVNTGLETEVNNAPGEKTAPEAEVNNAPEEKTAPEAEVNNIPDTKTVPEYVEEEIQDQENLPGEQPEIAQTSGQPEIAQTGGQPEIAQTSGPPEIAQTKVHINAVPREESIMDASAGGQTVHSITLNCSEGGTAGLSATEAERGTRVNISFNPESGYLFDSISCTGESGTDYNLFLEKNFFQTVISAYVNMPDEPVTINVQFAKTYPITVEKTGPAFAAVSIPNEAKENDLINIYFVQYTAINGSYYIINSVTCTAEDGTNIPVSQSGTNYSFTMPAQPVRVLIDTALPKVFLKSITASAGQLEPALSNEVTDYRISVPCETEEITLSMESEDMISIAEDQWKANTISYSTKSAPGSSFNPITNITAGPGSVKPKKEINYSVTGTVELSVGDNVINVTAASSYSGMKQSVDYTVTITRAKPIYSVSLSAAPSEYGTVSGEGSYSEGS